MNHTNKFLKNLENEFKDYINDPDFDRNFLATYDDSEEYIISNPERTESYIIFLEEKLEQAQIKIHKLESYIQRNEK